MNGDRDILSRLAAADAALPPPVAAPITVASLQRRLLRRRRQRAAVATLLIAGSAAAFGVLRAPVAAATSPAALARLAELRAGMFAELDRVAEQLARLQNARDAAEGEWRRDHVAGLRATTAIEHFPRAYATFDAAAAAVQQARFVALQAAAGGHGEHR